MNIFRDIKRRGLYDYLNDLEDEELRNVFYISSIILKERKNRARIYNLLKQKENKNEDFSRKR